MLVSDLINELEKLPKNATIGIDKIDCDEEHFTDDRIIIDIDDYEICNYCLC